MVQRLDLQALLVEILGSKNVYFQPPSNIKMKFPCIVYKREGMDTRYANNTLYKNKTRYEITVVDVNPDSEIHIRLAQLPFCSYDRFFSADDLNHDVYSLYF